MSNAARLLTARFLRSAALATGIASGVAGCASVPDLGGLDTHRSPPRPPVDMMYGMGVQQQPVVPKPSLPQGVSRVLYEGQEPDGTILVDIIDKRLYHVQNDGTALAYPIATPRSAASIPPFENIVTRRAVNPTWTPTPSMRAKNPNLPQSVPGGIPANPLGVRALYLGDTLYRIHGTNAPESIGTSASSGCIRMHNEHVIHLYDAVAVGTSVRVYRNERVPGIGMDMSGPRLASPAPVYRIQ